MMPDDAGPRIATAPDTAAETRARLIARLRDAPDRPHLADAAHRIAARPPLGRLSGLLDEIDATVMARTLVLRGAAGGELRLEVCNRRLLGVRRPGDGEARRTLTQAGGAELRDLRQDLDRVLADPGARLSWGPPEGNAMLEQTGVSAQMLRQAWEGGAVAAEVSPPADPAPGPAAGPTADPPAEPPADPRPDPGPPATTPSAQDAPSTAPQADAPDPVARLCAAAAPCLRAGLLLTDGGETALAGTPEAVVALRTLARSESAAVLLSCDGGPRLTLLEGAPDAALLAIACSERAMALLTLPPTDAARLRAAWVAAMSRDPPS